MSDEASKPEPNELVQGEGALHVGGALHTEQSGQAEQSGHVEEHSADAGAGEQALRIAEAMVFASATPVTARALSQILPDDADADLVLAQLRTRYAGRGVELVEVAGGVQFRSAPDLADRLRKVVVMPRRLARVAMETLAIIAYHQPVTRPEIEEIRGTSLAQQTLDSLLEAGLVAPKGRKETPGRPTLWGTTEGFLTQFGLKDLRDLPRREDLLLDLPLAPPRVQAQAADVPADVSSGPPAAPSEAAAEAPAPEPPAPAVDPETRA
jgi:segregation and condensation protein B